MKIHVFVADDNAKSLKMLCSLLNKIAEIVGTAADGVAALNGIRKHKPDIAVLDLEMPGLNGIEITRRLMNSDPGSRVLICSVYDDKEIAAAALRAGALAFIPKASCPTLLAQAVEAAARGERLCDFDRGAASTT